MGLTHTGAIITLIFVLFFNSAFAIRCYECNSHKDSRCSQSVLPEDMKKDCSQAERGNNFTMCRKIIQNVEFDVNGMGPDTRVIRTCGWEESRYKGKCYHRGGYGGKQTVCSCMNDFCNPASKTYASALSTTICFIVYNCNSYLLS